jgi:acetyl esterase/lipase
MIRLRIAVLLVVCAACGSAPAAAPVPTAPEALAPTTTTARPIPSTTAGTSTTTTISTTSTTISTTTTSTTMASTTTTVAASPPSLLDVDVTRGVGVPGGVAMDVFTPIGDGPWPAVVLFHGGGWISGEKEDLEPLARRIAQNGAVVFNAGYEALSAGVFFPETFDQVTCAIRAAGALAESSGTDGLIVAGYSAGAHLGALSVFSDGLFDTGCEDAPEPMILGFAGISGPYDSDVYPQLFLNFGAARDDDPELWAAGNPTNYLAGHAPLPTLLMHGDRDFVVAPPLSRWFADALDAAGDPVELITFPELDHFGIVAVNEGGAEIAALVAAFARSPAG